MYFLNSCFSFVPRAQYALPSMYMCVRPTLSKVPPRLVHVLGVHVLRQCMFLAGGSCRSYIVDMLSCAPHLLSQLRCFSRPNTSDSYPTLPTLHVHVHMYLHLCSCSCMYMYMHVHVYLCLGPVYVTACTYMYMYLCACLCMCSYMYIHVHMYCSFKLQCLPFFNSQFL